MVVRLGTLADVCAVLRNDASQLANTAAAMGLRLPLDAASAGDWVSDCFSHGVLLTAIQDDPERAVALCKASYVRVAWRRLNLSMWVADVTDGLTYVDAFVRSAFALTDARFIELRLADSLEWISGLDQRGFSKEATYPEFLSLAGRRVDQH